jgi:hypothetical protein
MCKLQRLFVLLILTCPLSNQAQLGYQLGDTVAIFSLPNADSAWVTPMQRDSAAQGIVLVFVSHGCSFSQAYEGRLADLGRKLPQFGFALYLVNSSPGPGEDLLAMRGHVLEKTFGNRYLKDEHQAIARAFGVSRLPQAFVLQRVAGGHYILRYLGAIDDQVHAQDPVHQAYLLQAVASLSQGQSPALPYTRAMGCSLRWRP